MAFAIASGVKPEYGIYTAGIAGILISLFGGSKYKIGGPTGAFVPILLGIVITYGYADLLVAGFLAGILLCLMALFKIGSSIKFIPRPVTVGFTLIVAWNMAERKQFAHLLKLKTGDSLILLVTFFLTVFSSITTAVLDGLALALILFAKRMSNLLVVSKVLPDHTQKNETVQSHLVNDSHDCPQISMYTIEGPLFFGAAQLFEQRVMETINYKPKVLILRMGMVPFIDATGTANLKNIINHFKKNGGIVLLSGVIPQLKEQLKLSGLYDEINGKYFFDHTGEAINYAISQINHNKCLGCKHFAFHECEQLSRDGELDSKYIEGIFGIGKVNE